MNILFFLKKSKTNKKGFCPLYCRISETKDNEVNFSTREIFIKHEHWNSSLQKVEGSNRDFYYNGIITELKNKFDVHLLDAYKRNIRYSPERLKELITGSVQSEHTITELVDVYIKKTEKRSDIDTSTLDGYNVKRRKLEKFLADQKYDNLFTTDLPLCVYSDYYHWLLLNNCNNDYAVKCVNLFKDIIDYGFSKRYCSTNQFEHHGKRYAPDKPIIYFNDIEVKQLETTTFASKNLNLALDRILFQVYTGLSDIDVTNFRQINIETHFGYQFIVKYRKKTNIPEYIPLTREAVKLAEKYNYNFGRLTHYNKLLKEIGHILGINKRITSHVGRKTFGNIMQNRYGLQIRTISYMLGHKNEQMTRRKYVPIEIITILDELKGKDILIPPAA